LKRAAVALVAFVLTGGCSSTAAHKIAATSTSEAPTTRATTSTVPVPTTTAATRSTADTHETVHNVQPAHPTPPSATVAATPKPQLVSLDMPSHVMCTGPTTITVSWSYAHANSLTISIDGPGAYDTYGPSGSASLPFACDGNAHSYTFTAHGPAGTSTTTNKVLQQ
jgi:uncharacterized protein YceK